jgi:class 3 adenylate cyclase/tetratricopeptide (TPR) repeat protein
MVSMPEQRAESGAPQGAVTILFTDVEGSTDLSTRVGDERVQELMRAQEDLVRREVQAHGGREVKSLGDGFMLAFPSPQAALDCAVAVQKVLDARRADGSVEVRMGLNTGEVTERGGDLFGATVNIAARVAAKARGGQILVSPVVRELVGGGDGIELVDRGLFWLKGIPERIRLFEVDWREGLRPRHPAPTAGRSAFVGREAEMADLRRLVEDAAGGRGGIVLLGGEPGVGKTRLAEEVAEEAARHRMMSLVGHCDEMETGTPYLPIVEIIESASRQISGETFRQALGQDASEIARLTPEIRRLIPDLPPPIELPPEQARRFLFNSVWEFLDRASRLQPLLLILDDLHWADEATLQLVQHLAERIADAPVLVLGTYRDVELDTARPLARTLEELVRRRLVARISVKRLPVQEVRNMLEALARQEPPATLVDAVYAETEGNPFFVEEVYEHLSESGRLFDERGGFRSDLRIDELDVPESVRLAVGRRLERLSEETRRALAAAAVVGRRFRFDVLEAIEELDQDALVDALDEAERARLVGSAEEGLAPAFTFAHELIRQTLLSHLSLVRRQRLHAKAAAAIERIHSDRLEENAADLAHHLLRAGSSASTEDAAKYLLMAGKRALEAAAFEEALRHLENAVGLHDALDATGHADLLFNLGLAQRSVGRWEEAVTSWRRAVDELESLGDAEAAGRACWYAASHLGWAGRFDEALIMVGRGLAAVEGRVIPEHARLLSMGGLMFGSGGYYEAAHQMLDQGLDLAHRLGDNHVRGAVLSLKTLVLWEFMEDAEAVAAGLEAERLLTEAGDLFEVAQVLSFVQFSMLYQGRFDEAAAVRERGLPLAERFGHPAAYMTLLRGEALELWMRTGGLEDYEPMGRRDLELNQAADLPWIAESYVFLGSTASYRGLRDEATELLEEAVRRETVGFSVGWHRSALFHHLALYGERDRALAVLDDPDVVLPVPGQPATTGSWAMLAHGVEGLGQLGERDRAASLSPLVAWAIERGILMEPVRGRLMHSVAGISAAAGGRWEEADGHFEAARGQADRLGMRLEQLDLLRFRAMARLWRGNPEDQDEALGLLAGAEQRYESRGMPRHVELCREMMVAART